MPHQKTIERKALIVGIVINILQVLAGMAVFFMTGLKAMFLDFSFTAISVLSGLVAAYLSSRTVRTTERFPNGMFALEPIYAICKAMLTMSLLLFSLVDVTRVAYDYFVLGQGGRIETGPVVIYEILTVAVCLGLYLYYRRENRRIRNSSTMLTAECKSTLVDGSMSFGIGVVAVFLWFLPAGGLWISCITPVISSSPSHWCCSRSRSRSACSRTRSWNWSAECMTTMRRTRSWSRRRSGICRRTPITSRYWCSRPA